MSSVHDAQLSTLIPPALKDWLAVLVRRDQPHGRVSEADVVRALLLLALPELSAMSTEERLTLYARINRSGTVGFADSGAAT